MTEQWVVKTLGKKYHYVDAPVDGKDTSYCGIHLYFDWERSGHELVPESQAKKAGLSLCKTCNALRKERQHGT